MAQFESFFQRADLDRDGRISGAEAVSFFQGSNLPQQVLAQVPPPSLSLPLSLSVCVGVYIYGYMYVMLLQDIMN